MSRIPSHTAWRFDLNKTNNRWQVPVPEGATEATVTAEREYGAWSTAVLAVRWAGAASARPADFGASSGGAATLGPPGATVVSVATDVLPVRSRSALECELTTKEGAAGFATIRVDWGYAP